MPTLTDIAMWSKAHPSWGMRRRVQRNYFAFLVAMAITGGDMRCPTCANLLDLDTAEVDRPIPSLDYRPGNVVTVCHGCNQGRSKLQSKGLDWRRAAEYARDIQAISADIPIPTERESLEWWAHRPTVTTESRYA